MRKTGGGLPSPARTSDLPSWAQACIVSPSRPQWSTTGRGGPSLLACIAKVALCICLDLTTTFNAMCASCIDRALTGTCMFMHSLRAYLASSSLTSALFHTSPSVSQSGQRHGPGFEQCWCAVPQYTEQSVPALVIRAALYCLRQGARSFSAEDVAEPAQRQQAAGEQHCSPASFVQTTHKRPFAKCPRLHVTYKSKRTHASSRCCLPH